MKKQVRKTISMSSSVYSKLIALAASYEGNVSMTIRFLVETAYQVKAGN